jgi:hypothetical protein
MPPVRGTCFGYEVRSPFSFSFLRGGSGSPLLVGPGADGDEQPTDGPLLEWTPGPGNAFAARLFRSGETYRIWIDEMGWFRVDPAGPSVAVEHWSGLPRSEVALWGIPASLCILRRGDRPIHAAAVEVQGRAVLLVAPGRYGKTTLAGAFMQAGYRVLAEDLSCCRLSPTPLTLPGPALLRLRRDVYEHLQIPGTRPIAENPARIYLAIDEALRGNTEPVPLRAIVFLRESDSEPTMTPVAAAESLPDLWSVSFKLPTDADRAQCFDFLARLAGAVPIWNLERRLDFNNLPLVVDQIAATCFD